MNKKIVAMILLSCLIFCARTMAEEKGKAKEKIEYKQYEKIDLGDLEIKGDVIAPGDISVKERNQFKLEEVLYERNDFSDKVREDVETLR